MKYRFEVTSASKELLKVADLMKRLDLGMDGIAITQTIGFTCKEDIEIATIKECIRKAIEEEGGMLYECKGGKIE